MGAHEQCHCPRCKRDVRVERPWRGFRVLWRGWLGLVVLLGLTAPVWATDLMVMMPTACFILLAGGSLSTFAKQPPTCRRCKLELTDPLPPVQSVQPF